MSNNILLQQEKWLKQFAEILELKDFPYEMPKWPEEIPTPALCFNLPSDEKERERMVSVAFVPLGDFVEIQHTKELQLFYEFPFIAKQETAIELVKLILLINNLLLVGHLTLQGDAIYFRHSYFYPVDMDMREPSVSESIFFSLMFMDIYEEVIEAVIEGKMTAEEAMNTQESNAE